MLAERQSDVTRTAPPSPAGQVDRERERRRLVSLEAAIQARVELSAQLCKICCSAGLSVLFEPCGHLVACQACAERVESCPVCREPILHHLRAFLS